MRFEIDSHGDQVIRRDMTECLEVKLVNSPIFGVMRLFRSDGLSRFVGPYIPDITLPEMHRIAKIHLQDWIDELKGKRNDPIWG